MTPDVLIHGLLGLLPVIAFLAGLTWLDSYKLVAPRWILGTIVAGCLTAGIAAAINAALLPQLDVDFVTWARYVAPLIEELLKGLVVIILVRLHRIGFLVDAAIYGFAVGAGFALVENLFYLGVMPDTATATWIVRGFGTAIMHGGATAMFAITGRALVAEWRGAGPAAFLPGLVIATGTHSVFNHFFFSPILTTVAVLAVLPVLLSAVFRLSEKSVEHWLDIGFDADTELLGLIHSGELSESRVGRYLASLKEKFAGPVVADLLCYLRLHVELALRAKGILMMRESGFDDRPDEETKAKLEERKYLEDSIGATGLLALRPFLQMSRRDLWQFYVLGK